MAADLRFVANAAQTHAGKLSSERVGDRLPETRFADAGRAEKTEDRSVPLRVEFAHGQIFDQPALDLFEIVMIAIENLLGLDRDRDCPRSISTTAIPRSFRRS